MTEKNKNNTQKYRRKEKPAAPKQSNKMRKELLGRIKEFQSRKENELSETKSTETEFQDEFDKSLSFSSVVYSFKELEKIIFI